MTIKGKIKKLKNYGLMEAINIEAEKLQKETHFIEVSFNSNNLPKGKLSKNIEEKHITLCYKPSTEEIKLFLPYIGKEVKIAIIGYANDSYTEGYEVEILTPNIPYMGQERVHITLSYALEKGAKPVDTGKLNFTPCERREISGIINFRKYKNIKKQELNKILIPVTIAEAIVIYRKRKGITQQQLAEFIGVSVSTVINYEKGKSIPDINTIKKLNIIFDFLTNN